MRPSQAVRIAEDVLDVMDNYLRVAQGITLTDEDDYQDFKDLIIDTIGGSEE